MDDNKLPSSKETSYARCHASVGRALGNIFLLGMSAAAVAWLIASGMGYDPSKIFHP